MFNIALTGGIASGKSTIGDLFANKNIEVIDADTIALELTSKNSATLQTIADYFGDDILLTDQSLNRQYLATIIFNDAEKKAWLENLLHPKIYHQLFKSLKLCQSPYSLSLVPLLVETKSQNKFNHVLVVDCDEATQIQRLNKRNGLNQNDALIRINAQVSNKQRLQSADDIITNNKSTSLAVLRETVNQLHRKFLRLSTKN